MVKPELHDMVQLKDGRKGTVIYLYDDGLAAEIEIDDPSGETVELADVESVLQAAPK